MSSDPLLSVRNLKKHYPITEGVLKKEVGRVRAVDGISFEVERGETLGLVGESGCGKSTAATSLLRLEEPTDGEVVFDGADITAHGDAELKAFRRRAQMMFQDPSSSFGPRMSVGESVAEPLAIHGMRDRKRRRRIVENLLERVGLSAAAFDRYPHEFSGGQKQRIALARALVLNPELIVADEPVSALDVSIQAEIISLMRDLQAEFGLAIVFISHDLGVVREVCDRVAVMYLGEIVEIADTETLFDDPQHPYTKALLSSIPTPDPSRRNEGIELTGDVPSPSNPPSGCRFHTRCPVVIQPDEFSLEQSEWRHVLDLRLRVERGIDVQDVREFLVAEGEADAPEDVPGDAVARELRREFDVPQTLSDPNAETILSNAISDLTDGEHDAARRTLNESFTTVCERDHPELEATGVGTTAACLRVGNDRQVDPPTPD
ncbi:ATP-binding cassette domain-containing protein [Haloferax mediterranei ATCC 33500]|uniref:ATP-binding cassette domain-containing protein n=1 Tax=Haloferax mediterranei (strain ATCC 33500 / DSM 1411 / JCM 8866 / NBRC 14739 / NCIMB 2177 / R-4) TaxID=523841 RepID=I3R3I4_HALMT|nr:oligopeptide/dipeptide ABC transporter ATP-binding protein [Haloferax mediterranei]AFK18794.1 dipeptide/oligopeptide/nickel ABC transporter ATP-binding protein [Haloferax mediterranei ATCC 33500]AHZ21838.1 peptide ABC transporter ATP-binding protein [Haloferax mediterranei ATCC 33500]EMA03347.1 dipeptide/oligopeptide/nickel ABC transporter ATP-binding protein [Haloferax mediterranei ATCC 33500]MDX5988889.1 oligopeptide/dipeptide ABC transporter ATP-binding protein [Haloferax mediterranei ATC